MTTPKTPDLAAVVAPIKVPVRTEAVGHLRALFDADGECIIRREDAAIVEQIAAALNAYAGGVSGEVYQAAVVGRREFREMYRQERERVKEADARAAKWEKLHDARTAELNALQADLAALRAELAGASIRERGWRDECARVREMKDAREAELADMLAEISALRAERDRLKGELERFGGIGTIDALRHETMLGLIQENARLEKDNAALRERLAVAEDVIAGLADDGTSSWESTIRCVACGAYVGIESGSDHEQGCAWVARKALAARTPEGAPRQREEHYLQSSIDAGDMAAERGGKHEAE